MKIISVFVSSVDGRITKGDLPPGKWASQEDHVYFQKLLQENTCIVMGSGTFDPKFITSYVGKLRTVLTSKPEHYAQYEVPGQIEFRNESPKELVSRLGKAGFTHILLVAGPRVTTAFFKEQLIDELWLTLEPKMFGNGKQILTDEREITLQLSEMRQMNKQGTLLLKYNVRR